MRPSITHGDPKKSGFVHSRIDDNVKEKASFILDQIGLSVSDAIRLFLKQVIIKKGLPFSVRIPNARTIAAIEAADKGEGLEKVTLGQLRKEFKIERNKIKKKNNSRIKVK